MKRDELQLRTKQFALRVIRMVDALPKSTAGWTLGKQVLRSATSVGANYRAARNARSRQEFIAKIGIVVEEADETVYWLELIAESDLVDSDRLDPLREEASELMKIFAATRRSSRKNANGPVRRPNDQMAK